MKNNRLIRNVSFKTMFRTPVKTTLYLILLLLISSFLTLSFGMWQSSTSMLKDAEEAFETVGVVEYVAGNYPDESIMDRVAIEQLSKFDFVRDLADKNVIKMQRIRTGLAYIPDTTLNANFHIPYSDYSVISFTIMYAYEDSYRCVLNQCFSGAKRKIGTTFYLALEEGKTIEDYHMELKKTYIGHGRLAVGKRNLLGFYPEEFHYLIDGQQVKQLLPDFPFAPDIENGRSETISKQDEDTWGRIIDYYEVICSSLPIVASENIYHLRNFLLNENKISEGEMLSEEDYETGAPVCIISNAIAAVCKFKVGDEITVKIHYTEDPGDYYNSYHMDGVFAQEVKLKVKGIYVSSSAGINSEIYTCYNTIESLPEHSYHYELGSIILKNGTDDLYLAKISKNLPNALRISVYDQGYMQAIMPIQSIQSTSGLVTLLCMICSMGIITLYVYMSLSKQKQTARIMFMLGNQAKDIRYFWMHGILTVTTVAAGIGIVLSEVVSRFIYQRAYENVKSEMVSEFRYSSLSLGKAISFDKEMMLSTAVAFAVAGSIILVTAGLTCLLSRRMQREIEKIS